MREKHLAHRGAVRGQSRTDVKVDRGEASVGPTGDVDDVGAVQDGEMDGLARLVEQLLEKGLRPFAEAEAAETREAEVKDLHARPVAFRAGVPVEVTELLEREGKAVRRSFRPTHPDGKLAQAQRRTLGAETAEHLEALGERSDGVTRLGLATRNEVWHCEPT